MRLGYNIFNGSKGEFAFERSNSNRAHDGVAGKISVSKLHSQYVTAFEIKPKSWDLDLDRNDKGELAFDQVVNTANGSPFLRQVVISNILEIRVHVPFYGSPYCERFSLALLADENNQELRQLLLAFLSRPILLSCDLNDERKALHDCIVKSRDSEKRQIDTLFDTYTFALNSASEQISRKNIDIDTVESRQLSALLVNRFLFASYAQQCGYLDVSVLDILKDQKVKTFEHFFRILDKGGDIDGVPVFCFNGGLFSRNERIDHLDIKNGLRKSIISLCDVNLEDLSPSILGRIFEKSLSATLADIPGAPSESHQLGAVYTPLDLAAAMVKHAFSILDKDINSVQILDPACGSGVFLLESLKYLLKDPKLRVSSKIEKIVNSQISGWDINPAAIELSRFMIWQYVLDLDLPLPAIKSNIHVGDALFSKFPKYSRTPDIVIGNPPFIAHQNMKREYKNKLERRYLQCIDHQEQYDIYVAFFEMAIDRVSKGGVVSLIAPNQMSFRPYAKKLRDYILKNHSVNRIVDLTEIGIFDKAVCPFVYVIQKGVPSPKCFPIYTNMKSRSDIIDAFEINPSSTEFSEINHSPDVEYLVRSKIPHRIGKSAAVLFKWFSMLTNLAGVK